MSKHLMRIAQIRNTRQASVRQSPRGITLLEVMAASIIMGLLVVAVLRAYSTATNVSGRAEIQAEVAAAMKESRDKWRNMVGVLQPGQLGPNQATGSPGAAWFTKTGQPNGPNWWMQDSFSSGTPASLINRVVEAGACNCDGTTIDCSNPLPPGVPPNCMKVGIKVTTSD